MLILIINSICFSLIFFLGQNYPDGMVLLQCTVLLIGLSVLLFRRGKKYISRQEILCSACLLILQPVIVALLEETKTWRADNHPLSGGGFGVLFYFGALILFNVLLLLTNIIKCIINHL